LRNFDDLKKWIANHFTCESLEIPDEIQLAPGGCGEGVEACFIFAFSAAAEALEEILL